MNSDISRHIALQLSFVVASADLQQNIAELQNTGVAMSLVCIDRKLLIGGQEGRPYRCGRPDRSV